MDSNRRQLPRSIVVLAVLALLAGSFEAWRQAHPDEWLRFRVIAAFTASDVWAMGTEVKIVRGNTVRLQGFVHHEEDRGRLVELAQSVRGVSRVRDKLYVTAWPGRETAPEPARVAFANGAGN